MNAGSTGIENERPLPAKAAAFSFLNESSRCETVTTQKRDWTNSTRRTISRRMVVHRQPTTLEYALLGLIHQAPQSGYDLRKIFETSAIGSFSGSPGAIYPALARLEKQGLIDGEIDDSTELRPRRVFRPTKRGRELFRAWLSRDLSREDVEKRIDEMILRFAFHGVLDDPSQSRIFLEQLARHIDEYIAELKAQGEAFPSDIPVHVELALAAGIGQYRAWARWARLALKRITEEQS